MTQYRCYFITAANKAEESFLIDASSPQAAADEAVIRCTIPTFVSVEIWDGTACALTRPIGRPSGPFSVAPARDSRPAQIGDV